MELFLNLILTKYVCNHHHVCKRNICQTAIMNIAYSSIRMYVSCTLCTLDIMHVVYYPIKLHRLLINMCTLYMYNI